MTRYASKIYHCINAISEIKLPKKEKHEFDLYTKDEQNRLKSALFNDMNITKLGILTTLYTGMRIGELYGLKWSDIKFKEKTIYIERTVQRIYTNERNYKTELIISTPKSQ